MGFHMARRATIAALRDGRFQHEERSQTEGKNLLASGQVTVEDVVFLLNRCKGTQHQTTPHHRDPSQPVDIFRPKVGGKSWYIKVYRVELDEVTAIFISVHQ